MNYLSANHVMSTIKDVLSRDSSRLSQALTLQAAESRQEIRVLLEHALNVDRAWLLTHDDERRRLKEAAYRVVTTGHHTYRDRLESMLERVTA